MPYVWLACWVPDETHEAMRDLVGTRESAAEDQRHKRQPVSAFVLRHGLVSQRTKPWSMRYRRWLQSLTFDHLAHQIALQALRGVAMSSTGTSMAEIGDVRRFETPVKLMA